MELRHLRYFVAVADAGSVSRAATQLRVTQPALSRQIRDLETELGLPLFDRVGRRLQLTAAGETLLARTRDVLRAAESLREEAGALVPTGLVRAAHREWLGVRAWTLRAEDRYLPTAYRRGEGPAGRGDLRGYAEMLLDLGVDGLITDQPELCLAATAPSARAALLR